MRLLQEFDGLEPAEAFLTLLSLAVTVVGHMAEEASGAEVIARTLGEKIAADAPAAGRMVSALALARASAGRPS
jgi:hypothetical protein